MSGVVWRIVMLALVVFLVSPILLLAFFSFNDGGIAAFPVDTLSLRWWRAMIEDQSFRAALANSLWIGVTVALIASALGTMAALGLAQMPRRPAEATIAMLSLPLMLPPMVLGVSLLSFYVRLKVPLGFATVVMSHLLFTLPFVIIVVYARLRSFNFAMVESARDLGASPMRAFMTITLPNIRLAVIGGGLLALALSLDDFVVTFFTIGTGNTLPTFVWGMIRTSLTPLANAIGTLIIFFSLGMTLVAAYLLRTSRN